MHEASTLADYQQRMAAALLHDTATHDESALQRWLADSAESARTTAGLAVYRNNVMYSLVTALRAQFPVTEALVGGSFFGALARDFVCQHPPRQPQLTFYGEDLPDFIARHSSCAVLPWLSDLARLEWLCQRALHAKECLSLQLSELLALPPAELGECVLKLHASVQLFSSAWPVQRIRDEHLKPVPEVLSLDCDSSTYLMIYRLNNDVQILTLQAPVFYLLQALQSALPLQAAWLQTQARFALPDDELTPMLAYLLRLQIFQQ